MKQILRTVRILLAVLFLFISLQMARLLAGESVCNDGGAWGIPIHLGILIGIGVGVISFIIWKWRSIMLGWMAVWGVLFLAGGLSNVYERVVFGCVMDYVRTFSWFPVFNMADVFLTIAVLGFLWENGNIKFEC
ncbi:MAG: signal peptidase II [Candidatus Moraniibacteriota bacterium]